MLVEDMLQLQLLQRGLHGGCTHGESPGCPDLRSRPAQLAKRSSIPSGAPGALRAFNTAREAQHVLCASAQVCAADAAGPSTSDQTLTMTSHAI